MKIVFIALSSVIVGFVAAYWIQDNADSSHNSINCEQKSDVEASESHSLEAQALINKVPELEKKLVQNEVSNKKTITPSPDKNTPADISKSKPDPQMTTSTPVFNYESIREKEFFIHDNLRDYLYENPQTTMYDERVKCMDNECRISMNIEGNENVFTMNLLKKLSDMGLGEVSIKNFKTREDGLKEIALMVVSDAHMN